MIGRGQPVDPEIFLGTKIFVLAELEICDNADLVFISAMIFRSKKMPFPKLEVKDLRAMELSAREAAILLGVSDRTFYRLVENDLVPRLKEGVYLLKDVVEGYAKSFGGSKGLTAAKIRQAAADAELKELTISERKGELVPISAVMEVYSENISNIRAKILAFPTKIAPELVGKDLISMQAKLKHEIYELLKELADYDADRVTRKAALQRKK
ncbi:MAG: hypothetical protein IJ859_13225 [Synergistaceae bacterium]|nr:hypothetical protein [Synergistaceae bacterium]